MRAVGCWKQTPGLLFSEEKSYCKGGRRLLRLGKRPVDASCGRDAKRRTSYRCPSFLEGTVKIDIFPFQGKAPIVWYTDRAPSVNGSRLESSRNVFVLRKGYTNILKR